jgi:hypothetical protein
MPQVVNDEYIFPWLFQSKKQAKARAKESSEI